MITSDALTDASTVAPLRLPLERASRTTGRAAFLLGAADTPAERHVALLAADPDFADAVKREERALATSALLVPRLTLEAGAWAGPPVSEPEAPLAGLVVLDGLVTRDVVLHGRIATELFGRGDVLDPWPASATQLGVAVRWTVRQPTVLAVLDRRFVAASRRWPGLAHVVMRRLAARGDRLAAQTAALQLSRVEDRVTAMLWQLADRWGRITPDGVIVPLTLTHQLLGQLVSARRSTVSLALGELAAIDAVHRRDDGSWFLAAWTRAGLGSRAGGD